MLETEVFTSCLRWNSTKPHSSLQSALTNQKHVQFSLADAEPEYSRQPDISTGSNPPGYPPIITPSGFPAPTAPIKSIAAPSRGFWSDNAMKPAGGASYPPVPDAPGAGTSATPTAPFPGYPPHQSSAGYVAPGAATDASSSYAAKPDTVVLMNDKPSYGGPTANAHDAPYSHTYSPRRDGQPVPPGAPIRPCAPSCHSHPPTLLQIFCVLWPKTFSSGKTLATYHREGIVGQKKAPGRQ